MLKKTSEDGLKKGLQTLCKLPFARKLLRKLSEAAQGNFVAFLSINRLVKSDRRQSLYPRVFTKEQLKKSLLELKKIINFVGLDEALSFLRGEQALLESKAVLILESFYLQSIELLLPVIAELEIPVCIMVAPSSVYTGDMLWRDEINYHIFATHKKTLNVSFIDRSFPLNNWAEKKTAAQNIIYHLEHCHPKALISKKEELNEALGEISLAPLSHRIISQAGLEKLKQNSLISFGCQGNFAWPFYEIDEKEALREIIDGKNALTNLLGSFSPIYWFGGEARKKLSGKYAELLRENGFTSALSLEQGLCHPADNMFRLKSISLNPKANPVEGVELATLADAVDEFLLITLAKDKEYKES